MEIQDLAEYILVKTRKMHESINNTQLNCLLFLIEAQNELEKKQNCFLMYPKTENIHAIIRFTGNTKKAEFYPSRLQINRLGISYPSFQEKTWK